jgi:uncharacterized membrane protein
MNRTAFVISVVLTTFVLMAVAGVVYTLRTPQAATETEIAPADNSDTGTDNTIDAAPTLDPSLEQALLDREKIYQQRIAEANARLQQAQEQLAAKSLLVSPQADSQNTAAQITPEQAMKVASDYLGQDSAFWVEIVSLKGVDTYMVSFSTGDLVYVSMAGQVVGSAPAQNFGGSLGGAGKKTVSTKGDDQVHEDHGSGGEGHETEHEGE